ncbi:cation-translocating P-type ATPase [Collinsella sp. AGMB00827]|uniref:Cation-translocating P-type ATPase n=2 Tax=Collinsella ureilytica TaxID=2869515 RepID=A0ABS7ML39_9ACTN|nr:cation-translocating P-type ATPase [Collinsella urealyticum]
MGDQSSDAARGLSAEEVAARVEAGLWNREVELKTKSVRELITENLFTVFNLINAVLAVLVLITGSWKNLTFLAIVVLNTSIGVIQALRSKRMVDKLTLLTSKRACAIRDGREVEVELTEIVLDDIVRLGRGDQIPADAVVISGEASVNESLLTGESDLIRKVPGSELMSGSFIDSGTVFARVIHVGADNYVSRINAEAKYVKPVNSEIMRSLQSIVRFAGLFMIPIGLALLWASLSDVYRDAGSPDSTGPFIWALHETLAGRVPARAILSVVGALLGMVPQGLVLLTSSVLAIATVRLARRRVLAQQLHCIETLARVDVLCLDKTGTITSGAMSVSGVFPIEDHMAEPLDQALAALADASQSDANETARALIEYYKDVDRDRNELLRTIPFSSARKYSGVETEAGSFVMGAASFVLSPHMLDQVADRLSELASTARVLIVGRVLGFDDEGVIIGEVEPLGFLCIGDEIRASAQDTIQYFQEQGVELYVISGDDPRTVSSIAKTVGIPHAAELTDASSLSSAAALDTALDRSRIFGRVTPQQKRELVVGLKRRGHTVAMTGDGVNDVLALKEADCSVAMAAGSDAARNVAEIVLVDNDFASMPAVVAEGRRSINNLQRSAALFLTKTLFSMALAALCVLFPPYPFEPIQMTLINFFCIGLPGFVLGLEPNRARVEGHFITNVVRRALPASVAVTVGCCGCLAASHLFGFSDAMASTMCLVSTSAVSVSLIWRISRPFTALRAALMVVVVCGISSGMLFFPTFYSIEPLSLGAGLTLVAISLGSCLLFWKRADVLALRTDHGRRPATGFGRGVRVSLRGRSRKVSSTGSAARQTIQKLFGRARQQASTNKQRKTPAKTGRLSHSPDGIRVRMNKRKKRQDSNL